MESFSLFFSDFSVSEKSLFIWNQIFSFSMEKRTDLRKVYEFIEMFLSVSDDWQNEKQKTFHFRCEREQ